MYASLPEAIVAPFLVILGANWAPFLAVLGSKSGDFGVLGRPGGASGSHVGPHGRPEGPKWPKMDEKAHPWDSLVGTIFITFSVFWGLFW